MRVTAVGFLTLLLVGPAPARGQAAGPALLFPGEHGPVRLRLEVRAGGRTPEAAWEAFLDRWFDYFDRDGDGSLSAAEAARVCPLPLTGGGRVVPDFNRIDADRDGKGSRAELKAFYRGAGFTPVVVVLLPPTPEDGRLSEEVFRRLDRDGDGKLTKAELARAAALVGEVDEDEDEVLTAAEVLSAAPGAGAPAPQRSEVAVAADAAPADAVLRVWPGDDQQPRLADVRTKAIGEMTGSPGGPFRLRVADGWCRVAPASSEKVTSFQEVRRFYLAQCRAGLGDRPAVGRKELEQDLGVQALAGLFEHADRDGDGKLQLAELDAFLELVGQGVACQTVVTVRDRGRNLFDSLDTDGNGRLDLSELNAAVRLLDGERRPPLTRDRVPRQFRLTAERGVPGTSFGPVTLAGRASRPKPAPAGAPRGPRWFQAMDRNGDGFLSPREFLGPPEVFRRLDVDGDGLISVDEAGRADRERGGTPPGG
jgi:Ca2+-binding EF-hand superfamily protein